MAGLVLVACGLLAWGEGPDAKAPDLAAYDAARAGVGRDAEAHVKLALWCEAHGLKAERLKHLSLAVLVDPRNATARGLLGLVDYRGRWNRPEAVAEKVKADEALTARLAEYNARRARAGETADAQWTLAVWCEQNGLEAEARAHFATVTRLDPGREAAWKRLGCKKVGGRWVTDAQLAAEKAEADAQKHADKVWKPLLTRYRDGVSGKDRARREKAEAALAEVNDPRAVPSVWAVFVAGGKAYHDRAVQVLGQIDAAGSSQALAFLAVFDGSPEVRRAAAETLKRRDPREFAGLLVALLHDPIKYQVRPVGGPGSPGALFVQGKRVNVQRNYAPPAMPFILVGPNDQISFDADGLPMITRTNTSATEVKPVQTSIFPVHMSFNQFAGFNPSDPALSRAVEEYRQNAPSLWNTFLMTRPDNRNLLAHNPAAANRVQGVSIGYWKTTSTTGTTVTQIPAGQIMAEYQKAALSAQAQLAQDVAAVDAQNEGIRQLNERVAGVLNAVAGQDRGEGREAWQSWWVDVQGYAYTPQPEVERPTVVEDVPLAYNPQPPRSSSITRYQTTSTKPSLQVTPFSLMASCFGAGTLVRTFDGSRPIESLKVGDRVLAQDLKSGSLGYQPVTVIHHNPPSPTFLVKVGGDTVVSSPFHRFWVAGKGWVMARDLRGGELLRLLDGPARVDSVESGPMQPVFNLDVAEAHDFFAGKAAALVHDNTLPDTRLSPFDAAPEVASAAR